MRRRSIIKFRPDLEQLDAISLLSASSLPTHVLHTKNTTQPGLTQPADLSAAKTPGFLLFRVTNTPHQTPYNLVPPFQQVLVQARQPIPGQIYNITSIAVKNGSAQTFTSSNGFTVRMTNQPRSFAGFPILTGDQQWKPGQILVFYVLTKKYYPVSFVSGGFQFNTGGRSSTAIPGPAGIFLRLKYNPATFAKTLNWIVAFGQGNETGAGAKLGLPNTSINELVSANTCALTLPGISEHRFPAPTCTVSLSTSRDQAQPRNPGSGCGNSIPPGRGLELANWPEWAPQNRCIRHQHSRWSEPINHVTSCPA